MAPIKYEKVARYKSARPAAWNKQWHNNPDTEVSEVFYDINVLSRRSKMPIGRPRKQDHLSSIVEATATTSADLISQAERLESLAVELRMMAKRLDEIGV